MAAALLIAFGGFLLVQLLAELSTAAAAGAHHDFLAFYGAGQLVLRGEAASLYDPAAMTAVQRAVIPFPVGANGYMPFINPPFAAVAFAPLGALPESLARWLWAGLNAALMAGCAVWLTRGLRGGRRIVGVALALASFPVYLALAEGQWSIVLLAAGLVALECARRGRWDWAGLALSMFWLKPQFIILPLVALIAARRWGAVAAAGLGGAALVLLSLPFTGAAVDVHYVGYLVQVAFSHFTGAGATEASVWQGDLASTEGLNGMLVGYLGQSAVAAVNGLWAALVGGVLALCLLAWRGERPGFTSRGARLQLAAGIAAVLLVNPNLFVQDCVLAFLLVDALQPLPAWARSWGLVLVAALGDVVLLDQPGLRPHLFTVVLLLAVVWVCGRAIAGWTTSIPSPA